MIVSSAWGVIVAGYKQCKLVDEALTSRGVDHFIPVIETLSIVRGRHIREHRPLFGDYILTSINSNWKAWLSIRGVAGMLMNDLGFPAQVVPAEMERLRRACDGTVFRAATAFDESISGFEYGQRVRPASTEHFFASQVGRYEGKSKRGDTALFSLFGREQRVEFKNGDLLAV